MHKVPSSQKLLVGAVAAGLATTVLATEPAGVNVGSFVLTPVLNVTGGYDSNVLLTETNETDSLFSIVNPNFDFSTQVGSVAYSIIYDVEMGTYFDSSEDDYLDQSLALSSLFAFDARNELTASASYTEGHEERGSGVTSGNASAVGEVVEFHTTDLAGGYTFGADGADGNLALDASYSRKIYDNFRDLTSARDRTTLGLGGEFKYRVGPKTLMTLDIDTSDLDYVLSASTLDSLQTTAYVGAEWEATGKTSGYAKVGVLSKDFDSSSREDFSIFSWDVGVTWAPRTYSTFDLSTSKGANESNGAGSAIETTNFDLGWNHTWADRLSTRASVTLLEEDYVGDVQSDETTTYTASGTYNMHRWLDFILTLKQADKDSNLDGLDYDKTSLTLGVQLTL